MSKQPIQSGAGASTPALLGGEPAFDQPINVTRALAPEPSQLQERLASIHASRWYTNDGPLARELEQRLVEALGVGFCAAFCNGTSALQAALRHLDLSGEVITTPFTFPATVHAIEWNGLTPVFCDIDPESWNLDPARAAERVTSATSAIVPVHVFGNPCDVGALGALAEARELRLVYDAAHAFGARLEGRSLAGYGDLSVLSFHATKLFHTAEGGAVTGEDASHYRPLHLLRNFGIAGEDLVQGVGLNGKMSELHAALGLSLLEAAFEEITARARLAAVYDGLLGSVPGLRFQRFPETAEKNHAYYAIRVEAEAFGLSRDEVHHALRAENIVTRRYFFPLCSENESYRALPSARPEGLPEAHRLADEVLCLPLYGELGEAAVARCAKTLLGLREAAPQLRRALARHGDA